MYIYMYLLITMHRSAVNHNSGPDDRPDDEEDLATIEAAVVALRRAQARRTLARLSERRGQRTGAQAALPDAVFELLDAVAAAERDGALTVSEAAAALGVDQPRASRLAAQALDARLLRRRADQEDGRRSLLTLTPSGRRTLARIGAFRRGVIAEATGSWSAEDRAVFAALLHRFTQDFTHVTTPTPDT